MWRQYVQIPNQSRELINHGNGASWLCRSASRCGLPRILFDCETRRHGCSARACGERRLQPPVKASEIGVQGKRRWQAKIPRRKGRCVSYPTRQIFSKRAQQGRKIKIQETEGTLLVDSLPRAIGDFLKCEILLLWNFLFVFRGHVYFPHVYECPKIPASADIFLLEDKPRTREMVKWCSETQCDALECCSGLRPHSRMCTEVEPRALFSQCLLKGRGLW